jgi:hypothetical protein
MKNNKKDFDIRKDINSRNNKESLKIDNEKSKNFNSINTINENNFENKGPFINNLSRINNNKFDNEINSLIKNRIDKSNNLKENKNILFNSNWNHVSNFKLNIHTNENILHKDKFLKNTPLRDKLTNEKSNMMRGIILPNIKSPILNKEIKDFANNITPNLTKTPKLIFSNTIEPKCDYKDDRTSFFKNIKLNKIINANSNNLSDNTQATTIATSSTKKIDSSKANNMQSVNGDSSQYGMNLISTTSSTNNNIIIPILTMSRPASNFNCGGGILHSFNNNETKFGKNNDKNENNYELNNFNNGIKRSKVCKSQEIKGRFTASMKNKNINNLFPDMQRLIPNFHKIKIEKGMFNPKLGNSLTKKISFENKNLYGNNMIKIKNFIQ